MLTYLIHIFNKTYAVHLSTDFGEGTDPAKAGGRGHGANLVATFIVHMATASWRWQRFLGWRRVVAISGKLNNSCFLMKLQSRFWVKKFNGLSLII